MAQDPVIDEEPVIAEREFLTLLSSKAEQRLGWTPSLGFDATIAWTAEWYFEAMVRNDARTVTDAQIARILRAD